MVLKVSLNTGINRIRLEFKGYIEAFATWGAARINKIRLEFKDNQKNGDSGHIRVLIESDWNLKILA